MHWCFVSLVIVFIFALLLRLIASKLFSNRTVLFHIDEFIGNLCSGVFIMELGVIGSTYGKYSAALLLAGFIHLFFKFFYFNSVQGYMSPLTFISQYYRDGRRIKFSLFFVATIVITQFVALFCAQKLAKFIWSFEDESHVDALQWTCTTALSYPWKTAALYEAFGVLIGTSVDLITPKSMKETIGALVTMMLYFFFTHISGSFLNPVIATMFSFRCDGHESDWEHLIVYWIAPVVGLTLAWEFWLGANKFMRRSMSKKKD